MSYSDQRARYMDLGLRIKEAKAELETLTRAGRTRQPFRAVFDLSALETKIAALEQEHHALYWELARILKGTPR